MLFKDLTASTASSQDSSRKIDLWLAVAAFGRIAAISKIKWKMTLTLVTHPSACILEFAAVALLTLRRRLH
jgi:hypothetical protein